MPSLQSNDFELFGVPQQFAQDSSLLAARWKDLQRQAHPDQFSAQDASAQRLAMQWSVRINEAYQRLKDPLKRATYLCELQGVPIDAHTNTAMPAAFLMQQIEWREALDALRSADDALQLQTQVNHQRQERLARCATLLDSAGQPQEAAQEVRALMFIARFAQELEQQLDELEQ
ncbi:MAG: Fe-S protein assembly co-chaperone HscB [Burkholderiales bacterium]